MLKTACKGADVAWSSSFSGAEMRVRAHGPVSSEMKNAVQFLKLNGIF